MRRGERVGVVVKEKRRGRRGNGRESVRGRG